MARTVKQFRYYGDSVENKNQPSGTSKSEFISGDVFEGHYPIYQLGIQTLPGTLFYLNNGLDPIMVGATGIYELELEGTTEISKMYFNKISMDNIEDSVNGYLIVDIIYDDGIEEGAL